MIKEGRNVGVSCTASVVLSMRSELIAIFKVGHWMREGSADGVVGTGLAVNPLQSILPPIRVLHR